MAHELRKAGLEVVQQRGVTVTYDGVVAGQYFIDMMVEQALLVELKVMSGWDEGHRVQCVNYLKASDLRLCLLLNFGKGGWRSSAWLMDFDGRDERAAFFGSVSMAVKLQDRRSAACLFSTTVPVRRLMHDWAAICVH